MARDLLSREQILGFLEQTSWTSPGDGTGTYEVLRVDADSFGLDIDADVSQNDTTSTTGVIIERARSLTDVTSGMPKISYSMPADRQNLAVHVAAALHNVVQVGTTPYQKTTTPLQETTVIDFTSISSREPHVNTLAGYIGNNGSMGWILENAILNTLGLTWDFNSRGVAKLMRLDAQWVGNEINLNYDLSGATFSDAYTSTWYNTSSSLFSLNISGITSLTGVCMRRFSFNVNNNVTSDCKTTGGKANNYKLNTEITAEVQIPYNTGTYAALKGGVYDGFEATFALSNNIASGTAGHFAMTLKGRIINSTPITHNNGYQDLVLQLRCEKPSSGSSCSIVIADAIDRSWQAS